MTESSTSSRQPRIVSLVADTPSARQRLLTACEAEGRLSDAGAVLAETARQARAGIYYWKTPYYHLVRLSNELLAAGREDRVAALLTAAVAAWREQDPELCAWALFLQGSLALRRGELGPARALFTKAQPYLPFLAHTAVGEMFARRAEAPPAAIAAQSAAALTWEASAASEAARPVTCVACDGGYLRRFAPLFLAVLNRFAAPGGAVHLHVVDPADDAAAFMAELARLAPKLRLGWSREPSPEGLTDDGRRTYYTFARFVRLNEIAARYPGAPLLVADIDACVLADPAAFVEPLSARRPLALQYHPENLARIYDGVGGGLVVLRQEPAVMALFERVRRFLLSWTATRRIYYFLDQMALTAGVDDALRRPDAPEILRLGVEGRIFCCGAGRFAQILEEKSRPDFAAAAERLIAELRGEEAETFPAATEARILAALGLAG